MESFPQSTAECTENMTALGHPTTRASLGLSPPSLTGAEAQVAFEGLVLALVPSSHQALGGASSLD